VALKAFKDAGLDKVAFHQLDVTDDSSLNRFVADMKAAYPRIDVLINNGGVVVDVGVPIHLTDVNLVQQQFNVNTLGPLKLMAAFLPGMRMQNYGRIVNVSSGMGVLNRDSPKMGKGTTVGYRVSKTALNTLTRAAADENEDYNILVNSICPGLCLTDTTPPKFLDMAKAGGRTAVHGAVGAIWAATLPSNGPRGTFTRDKSPIDW